MDVLRDAGYRFQAEPTIIRFSCEALKVCLNTVHLTFTRLRSIARVYDTNQYNDNHGAVSADRRAQVGTYEQPVVAVTTDYRQ